MKGKETKKEKKKGNVDGSTTKIKSDYQNEKTRKSLPEPIVTKSKK